MKLPSYLPAAGILLALAGGLASPVSAQHERAAPDKTKSPPPPAVDQSAHKSDAGGTPLPRAGRNDSNRRDEFDRIDTDRDGRISPKEYAASDRAAVDMVAAGERDGVEAPNGGFELRNNEGRPDRSKFFRRLDTDKDGYISRDELSSASREGAKGTKN